MIYLLLSIFFSSVTVSLFKVFERKKVNTFQAIVVNYFTCSLVGSSISDRVLWQPEMYESQWIWIALGLGFLFISIFYCIALTAQLVSISASMVAAKLSIVVPVLLACIFYEETLGLYKIIGIIFSLLAVYFISKKDQQGISINPNYIYLPVLVFLGSGAIDALLNYLETRFIPPYSANEIVTATFFFAFVLGLLFLVFKRIKQKEAFQLNALLWGGILGIPNYFSMYFLVKTLQSFEATFIFPINNIGIVALSALIAYFFFGEKLNKQNLVGLSLALLAILLISLS